MPVEILIQIAKWIAQDELTLPETRGTLSDLRYSTNNGELRRYRPWSFFFHDLFNTDLLGSSAQPPKRRNRSILSLSLTCVRICRACVAALYHDVVVHCSNHQKLNIFLDTITKNESAYLQKYVTRLAVTYNWYIRPDTWKFDSTQSIQDTIASGAVRLPVLRSLYITKSDFGHWRKLLPTLPALECLTLKDVELPDRDFPVLPRLKTAHFCHCSVNFTLGEFLIRHPSLRELVNICTFDRTSRNMFEPVRDTLESLVWVASAAHDWNFYDERPDITYLRQLRHLATRTWIFTHNFDWGATLWEEEEDLVCMESLETVEVITSGFHRGLLRESPPLIFRKIVETLKNAKKKRGFKSLRVVDLRSFEKWQFCSLHWKIMKDGFLDAAMREYKQLGIVLLLPEIGRGTYHPQCNSTWL
ncbi:uncharacterized protein GLRG_10892 [Colletotrichum graminicola M1.001]|uniref:F-box domain-containing protein n=1 Tax=Colletotrichum graminicola (strain M1.001 / M2 / FGSC 10212) TaxID=645133 RepID=E3QXZ9_COLGM|nr:uncharacterized protein GLRG_10892 [Colletotrichum graminicola M1.001]EFQ35737.1 hypothetical protein GLRG_10892 [Colletotrichum graminicola M1.001]